MKQEVIQDFLNLPGIAGVALMDGRSRPYFCGVDQTLNFQQKEALAQGILQVVETIPDGFESFEFHFTDYQVHIYRLAQGIILLVLARTDLDHSVYLRTIKDLKAALQEDVANAIAVFRLIAGTNTLSSTAINSGRAAISTTAASPPLPLNSAKRSAPTPVPPSAEDLNGGLRSAVEPVQAPSLKQTLEALNQLSQFSTHYLGKHVIVNYWKSTRPSYEWLECLQIDRSAYFSLVEPALHPLHRPLSADEQQWIRAWVQAYTERCAQVIREFPNFVQQRALNAQQRAILLG